MATSILAPAQTAGNSSNITVGDDEQVVIALYTTTGVDVPPGPALGLQRQDINGNFITVATAGYGQIFLSRGCQQLVLTTPGVYRVVRPDITAWLTDIGVQQGL